MGLRDVDEKSIRVIRSELIASKDGLTTYEISNFYKDYFKEPLGKSERDVEDWLDTQTSLCSRSRNIHGKTVWHAVTNNDTAHVQKLVGKQKPKKKKSTKELPMSIVRSSASQCKPTSYTRTVHANRTVMTRSHYEASKRMTMLDSNRNLAIVNTNEKYVERNKQPSANNWENNSLPSFSPNDGVSRSESPQMEEYYPKDPPPRDLARSKEMINSDGTNDERQSDFGSTNSDSQMSHGGRPTKTSGSRYKLTREGMKRFLIDQVAKSGIVQFEDLHEVFNNDFMVKRLKRKPITSEKFSEIMKWSMKFCNELHIDHLNGTVSLPKKDTDKGTQTELSMNTVLCTRCKDRDNLESVMLGMESRIMSLIEKLLKKRKRNPFP